MAIELRGTDRALLPGAATVQGFEVPFSPRMRKAKSAGFCFMSMRAAVQVSPPSSVRSSVPWWPVANPTFGLAKKSDVSV